MMKEEDFDEFLDKNILVGLNGVFGKIKKGDCGSYLFCPEPKRYKKENLLNQLQYVGTKMEVIESVNDDKLKDVCYEFKKAFFDTREEAEQINKIKG